MTLQGSFDVSAPKCGVIVDSNNSDALQFTGRRRNPRPQVRLVSWEVTVAKPATARQLRSQESHR